MRLKKVWIVGAGCLVLVDLIGCREQRAPATAQKVDIKSLPVPRPTNPPVVIVGGCIRVQHGNESWKPPSTGNALYTAPTDDSSQITTRAVSHNGVSVGNLSVTSGWALEIYDPNSKPTVRTTAGITICSDASCKGKGDGMTVYVKPRTDDYTGLESANNSTELRFHSTVKGCDSGMSGNESKKCDHIGFIKFYDCSQDAQCAKSVQWDCGSGKTQGTCDVQIGPKSLRE